VQLSELQGAADLETELAALKEEVATLRKELNEVLALAPIKSLIAENRPVNLSMSVEGAPSIGAETAKLTLVEFSDFQCPYCGRHVTNTYPDLKQQYIETGKMKYVFRDFPLSNHKLAPKAAEAAHCAGEQDKFWEMHDRLWENAGKLQPADLKEHAVALGLDPGAFGQCLDSGRYAAVVGRDTAAGAQLGVSGTPAFFINGRPLTGAQPFEAFAQVIEEELALARRVPAGASAAP